MSLPMSSETMPERRGVSVVTNASPLDVDRLRLVIPHWLRVFGTALRELHVVIDPTPPVGRLAAPQGSNGTLADVREFLASLERSDRRIHSQTLVPGARLEAMLAKWFGADRPIRCQAGTPIAAFVAAFEAASGPIVLRADCDMLFHEAGWLDAATRMLVAGEADLVEPSRCGRRGPPTPLVSTRALLIHAERWRAHVLPLQARRLDWPRRLHRRLSGRPPWLALEQTLSHAVERGRIMMVHMPEELGCWLHISTREEARLAIMPRVAAAMEAGLIPAEQRLAGHNFSAASWAASSLPMA
jgi:hypothetical protein